MTKATPEMNDILERVFTNAQRVITNEQTGKVLDGILNGGQSAGEGLANAITYVLQSTIGGLQKKGIEVPPELIMSENGAASQITQLLVGIIRESGADITPNELQKAMEIGVQNFGVAQGKQAQKIAEAPQPGQAPPQAPPQDPGLAAPPRQQPGSGLLAGGRS